MKMLLSVFGLVEIVLMSNQYYTQFSYDHRRHQVARPDVIAVSTKRRHAERYCASRVADWSSTLCSRRSFSMVRSQAWSVWVYLLASPVRWKMTDCKIRLWSSAMSAARDDQTDVVAWLWFVRCLGSELSWVQQRRRWQEQPWMG